MAIAFGAAGSAVVGTTSLAVPHPTGITAGQLLVLFVASKYPENPPALPPGWWFVGSASGGAGAAGVDTGTALASFYIRVADGLETGNLSVSIPSGSSCVGQMYRYTKAAEHSWVLGLASGARNVGNSATFSLNAAGNPSIVLDDVILVGVAINTNNFSYSAQALTSTGATFTHNERLDGGTANGDQVGAMVSEFAVTAGPGTTDPAFVMTATGSTANAPAGPALFLRLREGRNRRPRQSLTLSL
jgi:hypothetical protein